MAYKKCEDCGKTTKDVEEEYDPVQEEVYDELVPIQVCGDCYQERMDEI